MRVTKGIACLLPAIIFMFVRFISYLSCSRQYTVASTSSEISSQQPCEVENRVTVLKLPGLSILLFHVMAITVIELHWFIISYVSGE